MAVERKSSFPSDSLTLILTGPGRPRKPQNKLKFLVLEVTPQQAEVIPCCCLSAPYPWQGTSPAGCCSSPVPPWQCQAPPGHAAGTGAGPAARPGAFFHGFHGKDPMGRMQARACRLSREQGSLSQQANGEKGGTDHTKRGSLGCLRNADSTPPSPGLTFTNVTTEIP